MCGSLGMAVREREWRKTIVIKDGCDYSLQRTSILMGKQHNLNNSEAELLTLCSCRRLRLRFRAGYEGIYRLSVFVCVCLRFFDLLLKKTFRLFQALRCLSCTYFQQWPSNCQKMSACQSAHNWRHGQTGLSIGNYFPMWRVLL